MGRNDQHYTDDQCNAVGRARAEGIHASEVRRLAAAGELHGADGNHLAPFAMPLSTIGDCLLAWQRAHPPEPASEPDREPQTPPDTPPDGTATRNLARLQALLDERMGKLEKDAAQNRYSVTMVDIKKAAEAQLALHHLTKALEAKPATKPPESPEQPEPSPLLATLLGTDDDGEPPSPATEDGTPTAQEP